MKSYKIINPDLPLLEIADVVLGLKLKMGVQSCPFHNDSSPSFSVYKSKTDNTTRWNCFAGCGHGDAIELVRIAKELNSYWNAAALVAEEFPDYFEVSNFASSRSEYDDEHLIHFTELAKFVDIGSTALFSSTNGEKVLKYLKDVRYLSENTIKEFKLGYIPKEVFGNMELSGLFLEKALDNLRPHVGRLLIPLMNSSNKYVIGFSSRALARGDRIKYRNDSTSKLAYGYNKNNYIYGYAESTKHEPIYVVEGYLDVLSMRELGINAVALGGLSLPPLKYGVLQRHYDEIVLALDNDVAGFEATLKLYKDYSHTNFKFVLWDAIFKDPNDVLEYEDVTLNVGDFYEYIRNLWNNNFNDIKDNYKNLIDFIAKVRNAMSDISFGDSDYFVRVQIDKFLAATIAVANIEGE